MMKKALWLSVFEGIAQMFFIVFVFKYIPLKYFNIISYIFGLVYIIWFVLIFKIVNVIVINRLEQKYKYWKYVVTRMLSFIVAVFLFLVFHINIKIDIFPVREVFYADGMLAAFSFAVYFPLIIILDIIQCILWHKKKKVCKIQNNL